MLLDHFGEKFSIEDLTAAFQERYKHPLIYNAFLNYMRVGRDEVVARMISHFGENIEDIRSILIYAAAYNNHKTVRTLLKHFPNKFFTTDLIKAFNYGKDHAHIRNAFKSYVSRVIEYVEYSKIYAKFNGIAKEMEGILIPKLIPLVCRYEYEHDKLNDPMFTFGSFFLSEEEFHQVIDACVIRANKTILTRYEAEKEVAEVSAEMQAISLKRPAL